MNDQVPKKIAEKVEVLRVWLSEQMGTEVVTLEYDAMHRLHGFRVLLNSRPQPLLRVSREQLEEDRPVEEILRDLESLDVPELLRKPGHLLYKRGG